MIIKIQWIHLAPNEWGNNLMDKVANEHFEKLGYPEDVLIEVYEHAGWKLSYIWDKEAKSTEVVESANDTAVFHGRAAEWRKTLHEALVNENVRYQYLGCIRREDLAATA